MHAALQSRPSESPMSFCWSLVFHVTWLVCLLREAGFTCTVQCTEWCVNCAKYMPDILSVSGALRPSVAQARFSRAHREVLLLRILSWLVVLQCFCKQALTDLALTANASNLILLCCMFTVKPLYSRCVTSPWRVTCVSASAGACAACLCVCLFVFLRTFLELSCVAALQFAAAKFSCIRSSGV